MKATSKQDSTSEERKTEELITRDEIKDSPFHVIGTEQGFFGSVGKYRITEPKKTKKEVEKELSEITWNRIVQVMLILLETHKDVK